MLENKEFEAFLWDDGTLDTVVEVTEKATGHSQDYRYSDTSEYRNKDTGALDKERFFADVVFPNAACDDWGKIDNGDDNGLANLTGF